MLALALCLASVASAQGSDPPKLERLAVVGPLSDSAHVRQAITRWRPKALALLVPTNLAPWRARRRRLLALDGEAPAFRVSTLGPHRLIELDPDRLLAGGATARAAFLEATAPDEKRAGWTIAFCRQPLYDVAARRWRALGRRLIIQPLLERARVELVFAAGTDGFRRTGPVALDGWTLVHTAVAQSWIAVELEGPATARLIARPAKEGPPLEVARLTRTPRGAREW